MTKSPQNQHNVPQRMRRRVMLTPVLPFRLAIFGLASFGIGLAQQPFYTDDADTTAAGKFHLEVVNQFAVLQESTFPSLRQNAAVFQVNYGVTDWLEVGVDSPLLAVFNAAGTVEPRVPIGIGDTNLTAKIRLKPEGPRSPAFTVAVTLEMPTGNPDTSLGSGVADYGFDTILQKQLKHSWVLRVNNGLVLSGNTLTGVVGLAARGLVYFGGTSLSRNVTEKLLLGVELNGAYTKKDEVGKGQLQAQFAGKWAIWKTAAIDFGVVAGRFANSPRVGVQIGLSKDF